MSFNAIITADVKGLETGVDKAGQAIDKLAKTANEKLESIGKGFDNVGKKASIMSAAIVAAGGVMVSSFITQEKAERKLSAAINATGGDVEVLSARFKKFASDLQSVTLTGDETTLGMLQMAQTMGLTADQSERAVKNAIAMESAFGVSAASAMRYTAALEDGDATMLKRYIPALKAIEDESLLAAKAQEILGNAFEVAKEDAQTFGGSLTQLKNSAGDLMEEFGAIISKALMPLVEWAKNAVEYFSNLNEGTKKLIITVGGIVAAIGPLLITLGFLTTTIIPALVAGGTAIASAWLPITAIILGVMGAFYLFNAEARKTKKIIDELSKESTESLQTKLNSINEQLNKMESQRLKGFRKEVEENKKKLQELSFGTEEHSKLLLRQAELIKLVQQEEQSYSTNYGVIQKLKKEKEIIEDLLRARQGLVVEPPETDSYVPVFVEIKDEIGAINDEWDSLLGKWDKDALKIDFDDVELEKPFAKWEQIMDDYQESLRQSAVSSEVFGDSFSKLDGDINATTQALQTLIREGFVPGDMGVDALMSKLATLREGLEETAAVVVDYGSIIAGGITDFAASIGEAFADGNFDNLGSELIGAMGSMLSQFGAMLITAAVGAEALQALITQPWLALAAGIALVALGAAATKSAQKIVGGTTGGWGGGSMGGTNSYNKTSGLGDSSYRGAYKDDWGSEVVFKIGNNELVGVLENANNRRNRL